ncbi:urease accessory protein UreF [Yoonia sp. R2331]|uniref:urease accessory protein UreF n=1 Tax=Yoonia sp. R2331 TaxID=3237238 RepID=UPI0034E4544E
MNTDTARMSIDPTLVLAQWLSPGFPVGAFAYAHGLEAAIADGQVRDADSLTAWLTDVLENGSGRCDAILMRAGFGDAAEADAHARAFAASAERLLEMDLQGRAFCQTLAATEGMVLDALAYPVAVGQAAAQKGLPMNATVAMYLQAFVANLVSAAQRLMPLGQTEGQRVLNAVRPVVAAVTAATDGAGLDDLHSSAWMSDIAAMRHETMTTRIFRT